MLILYITAFWICALALLLLGHDLTTSLSSSVACLSNIGPGLGSVGPALHYADIQIAGKWLLSFAMLLGRLEIYAVVVLFIPSLWRTQRAMRRVDL